MDAYRNTPLGIVRVAMFPSGVAAIGVEVFGRDIDQPAAKAPAQLADFDAVVVHRDERDAAQWGSRIEVTPLLREPLEILSPRHYRLSKRKRVPLGELADEPAISVEGGLMVDDVLRSLATVSGVQPRIVQRVNDFRVTEELVMAGVGIALMPRHVLTARELIRKPLSGIRIARRIEAVTRAGATTGPAVNAVISILKSLAQDTIEANTRPQ
ncbi:MAG: LysR substrate-binding domain-containing protein [Mycobacterium sp.]